MVGETWEGQFKFITQAEPGGVGQKDDGRVKLNCQFEVKVKFSNLNLNSECQTILYRYVRTVQYCTHSVQSYDMVSVGLNTRTK